MREGGPAYEHVREETPPICLRQAGVRMPDREVRVWVEAKTLSIAACAAPTMRTSAPASTCRAGTSTTRASAGAATCAQLRAGGPAPRRAQMAPWQGRYPSGRGRAQVTGLNLA